MVDNVPYGFHRSVFTGRHLLRAALKLLLIHRDQLACSGYGEDQGLALFGNLHIPGISGSQLHIVQKVAHRLIGSRFDHREAVGVHPASVQLTGGIGVPGHRMGHIHPFPVGRYRHPPHIGRSVLQGDGLYDPIGRHVDLHNLGGKHLIGILSVLQPAAHIQAVPCCRQIRRLSGYFDRRGHLPRVQIHHRNRVGEPVGHIGFGALYVEIAGGVSHQNRLFHLQIAVHHHQPAVPFAHHGVHHAVGAQHLLHLLVKQSGLFGLPLRGHPVYCKVRAVRHIEPA